MNHPKPTPTPTALPADFCRRMEADLGAAAAPLLAALHEAPEVSVRINGRKVSALPSELEAEGSSEPVAWCPTGRYLAARPHFASLPQWHAGTFYVQDASSMIHRHIALTLLAMLPTDAPLVLDACAAPGGKTTAMADVLPASGLLVANEYMPQRAAILRENVARWGQHQVLTSAAPVSAFARAGERFHIVAVDAPCSGEGMMRKEPEAVRQWSEALIDKCAHLQREILCDAAAALLPGGFLIYSTCTFNTEENERNTLFLMDSLGLEPVAIPVPEQWGIAPAVLPGVEAMRFMPHRTRGEGLYVAVLRKPGAPAPTRIGRKNGKPRRLSPTEAEALKLLQPAISWDITTEGTDIYARPEAHAATIDVLRHHARRMDTGLHVATIKGRDIIPSPALALSDALRREAFPCVDLTLPDALAYLRREPLTLPSSAARGINLIAYSGIPLGWAKHLGTRTNNLYPAEWRLRTH